MIGRHVGECRFGRRLGHVGRSPGQAAGHEYRHTGAIHRSIRFKGSAGVAAHDVRPHAGFDFAERPVVPGHIGEGLERNRDLQLLVPADDPGSLRGQGIGCGIPLSGLGATGDATARGQQRRRDDQGGTGARPHPTAQPSARPQQSGRGFPRSESTCPLFGQPARAWGRGELARRAARQSRHDGATARPPCRPTLSPTALVRCPKQGARRHAARGTSVSGAS